MSIVAFVLLSATVGLLTVELTYLIAWQRGFDAAENIYLSDDTQD